MYVYYELFMQEKEKAKLAEIELKMAKASADLDLARLEEEKKTIELQHEQVIVLKRPWYKEPKQSCLDTCLIYIYIFNVKLSSCYWRMNSPSSTRGKSIRNLVGDL